MGHCLHSSNGQQNREGHGLNTRFHGFNARRSHRNHVLQSCRITCVSLAHARRNANGIEKEAESINRKTGKHKIKKQFLDELEQDLLHYQKTHPNADYNDLLTQFGEPSEIQNMVSYHSLTKLHPRNMILYWCSFSVFFIILIILIWLTIQHVCAMREYADGYYVEYFEEDNKNIQNINPINGKPDPTPVQEITFD